MTTFKIKSVDLELSTYSLEESMMIEEKEDLQSSNKNIDSQINNIKETNFDLINHRLKLQESMNADTTRTVNWYASIARCNKDINDNTEELGGLRNRKKSNILRISEINSSIRDIWKSSNSVETSEDNSNAGPLRVLASMFNVGMGVIVR